MRNLKRWLLVGATFVALSAVFAAAMLVSHNTARASGGTGSQQSPLTLVGDTTIGVGTIGPLTDLKNDKTQPLTKDISPQVPVASANGHLPPPPTTNPNPTGLPVTSKTPNATGFNGLTQVDQRLAGAGVYANTQFSLEPPDQGLCVGHGYVMESINNALAIYSQSGKLLSGPTPNSQFFKLAPEINRTTSVYGPFISDPKCAYDEGTNRWYMTELMMDNGNNPGATGRNYQLIAVSQSANPNGNWTIFKFDTTDDGLNGTPSHAGCPCFGDQPLIGLDRFGFYITTNEFGTGFNGSQVYAISKHQLVKAAAHSGATPSVTRIDASSFLVPFGGLSYSLQPAISAPGEWNQGDEHNQDNHHGIEYFLSALQFGNPGYTVLDNRIAAWALSNTGSLDSKHPNLTLSVQVIASETYGQPNPMTQKAGPTPLADLLKAPEEQINSNDDRMNQVVFSDGALWGAVNTLVGDGSRTAIAYFKVRPSWEDNTLNARMVTQGYVAVDGNNVAYPSVAINANGQGAIAFTLVGPNYYPSAAYVNLTADGVTGPVHVSGAGQAPDDGFTGYAAFGGPGYGRWGDYSAAEVAPDGSIWLAHEYIPNPANFNQIYYANWGTFITHLNVGGDNNQGD